MKKKTASAIEMRDNNDKLIAGIVMFENEHMSVPYFIGMDYDVNRKYNLYYNILWEAIACSVNRNKKIIDMGLTTYDIKRRLGASILPITIYSRFKNRNINKIFNWILPLLLGYRN